MNKIFLTCLIFFMFAQVGVQAKSVCNFESVVSVSVTLNPRETISSKESPEGKFVDFCVKNNVYYKGKLLVKRGEIVTGRVETIATQGMNGIPAMIILGNFNVPGLDSQKLKSYYIKRGFNMTYFVLPIKWALTPLPPTGSLTNFIFGGTAKIKPKDDIVIKYYPEWECVDRN
ncbi:MAG: hypothetical protein NC390_08095 [Fusobacterium sp.]|nr:hypothetical protein [Fusobacterium sp.]